METGPKWYITRGQQRIGPLDASQLKHMARTEQLGPTEFVWKEGMAQWVQAQQVQGLFDPPEPEPVEPEAERPAADVSPVIAAYVPPAQQPAAPLIGAGSMGTSRAPSTQPTPVASTPAAKPIESAKVTTPSPTVAIPATAIPAATPAARPIARPTATTTAPRPALASHRSALPAVSTSFDGLLPILGGILILATIGIPWRAAADYPYGPVKVMFSWDLLKRTFAAGGQTSLGIWLIGSWVAGLAAIVITPLTKGALRGAIYSVLGAIVVTLFFIAFSKTNVADPFKSGLSELEKPLGFIAGILTFAAFVVMHLVRRSGPNLPLKITQFIVLGALVIITIILLITAFAANSSIWSQYGKYPIKSPHTGLLRAALLVNFIGTIIAAALLLLSAILGGRRGALSGAGLLLLYVIALTGLVTDIVIPAGAKNEWDTIYAEACAALLSIGTALILGAGLVQMIDHIRRGNAPIATTAARPASSSAPGETLEQKFAKLDQLRKTGVISDTEYQQKRAELLKQL